MIRIHAVCLHLIGLLSLSGMPAISLAQSVTQQLDRLQSVPDAEKIIIYRRLSHHYEQDQPDSAIYLVNQDVKLAEAGKIMPRGLICCFNQVESTACITSITWSAGSTTLIKMGLLSGV